MAEFTPTTRGEGFVYVFQMMHEETISLNICMVNCSELVYSDYFAFVQVNKTSYIFLIEML